MNALVSQFVSSQGCAKTQLIFIKLGVKVAYEPRKPDHVTLGSGSVTVTARAESYSAIRVVRGMFYTRCLFDSN